MPVDAVQPGSRYRQFSPFRKRLLRLVAPFMGRSAPALQLQRGKSGPDQAHVDIPVIVVGGIRTLQDVTSIVTEKNRLRVHEPALHHRDQIVARFQKGQAGSRCINCGDRLMGVTSSPLKCYYGIIPRKRKSLGRSRSVTPPCSGSPARRPSRRCRPSR